MSKYGKRAQEQIEKRVSEHKQKGVFKNRKQAIAVGISEARKKGYKVPKPP